MRIPLAACILAALTACGVESGSRNVTVLADCYCGETELIAVEAHQAIRAKDAKTIVGFIGRGQIKALEPGQSVTETFTSGPLSRIRTRDGRRCWIPTGLLSK